MKRAQSRVASVRNAPRDPLESTPFNRFTALLYHVKDFMCSLYLYAKVFPVSPMALAQRHFFFVVARGLGHMTESQNTESQKTESRKIEESKYRKSYHRMVKISNGRNTESHIAEWSKYRKSKC
ncbi:hypothetical protein M514_17215 [Trichuris suis]|uniref:Uncharacterized protein n=1 Tax=Trichuris suis TaxID=68888 RepID=A0A085NMP7_9BILA|nr:hypothetical protein M514_17215 [Trichuris suis]